MNKNILHIPSLAYFNNDWDVLQNFLKHRGNPPYHIDNDLDLAYAPIKSIGNLKSVGGSLKLRYSEIKDLGNLTSVGGSLYLNDAQIKDLGNLTSVGCNLYLRNTSIKDLGNLTSVKGHLVLQNTPLSKKITEHDIRSQVNVEGGIYFK